jgi:hypothetical protein
MAQACRAMHRVANHPQATSSGRPERGVEAMSTHQLRLARPVGAAGHPGIGRSISRVQQGLLILADISGFTGFMTSTELEHAAAMVGVLLTDVMKALSPPLQVQELEGDAVFALGPEPIPMPGLALLEILRGAVSAFRERRHVFELDSSCSCRACANVAALDLKLIVHHGRFIAQRVGGRSQVAGPDVVLAHRLLKNVVDGRAYVLLTKAAIERLELNPSATGLDPYTGHYDHFGEVAYFAGALEPRSQGAGVYALPAAG